MLRDHGRIQKEALEDHDWFEELSELHCHSQSTYAGHVGAEKLAELAEHNLAVEELVRIRSKFAVGYIQSEVAVGHIQSEVAVSHSRSGIAVGHSRSRFAVGHNQSGLAAGRIQFALAASRIQSRLAVGRIRSGLAAVRVRPRLVGHSQFEELVVAVRIQSELTDHVKELRHAQSAFE